MIILSVDTFPLSPTQPLIITVSALTGLSAHAQQLVADKARFYCKTLHDYSMAKWSAKGPARFQQILFLGDTINKCFGDVQNLVNMLLIFHPNSYSYKRLFIESLEKLD